MYASDLAVANSDRRPPLYQQSSYAEMSAVQGVMQGRNPITLSTPRVIYIRPTFQQQSYNF